MKTLVLLSLAGCYGGISSHPGELGGGPDAPEIVHVTGPKQMFVTSMTYQGGLLGGLTGADAKCNALAASHLTGTFAAWLSTSSSSPSTRFTRSSGPYQLVDGTIVAASYDALVAGTMMHAVDLDETGAVSTAPVNCMGKTGVWTATEFDGTAFTGPNSNCEDWTKLEDGGFYKNGLVGDISMFDSHWTDTLCAPACTQQAPIYCVEQ